METVATHAYTKKIIQKYGFHTKKSYGQNFLVDTHVLNKITTAADITKDDLVIEIGPGIGALSQKLAESCKTLLAVEIDKQLIPVLEETLADFDNVILLNEDVLKVDLGAKIKELGFGSAKLIANLPYYITTPIVAQLLEGRVPLEKIVVMVQKEVALRMKAAPGTADYGALSLMVQYYSMPEIVANVPVNSFIPRPRVDSSVISLTVRKEPPVSLENEKLFFRIIKSAFGQRRKTLLNCLYNADYLNCDKTHLEEILINCGLDVSVRGETLGLEEFARLANLLA